LGYALTSVANLPIEDNVNLYIFILGNAGWHGDLYEIVDRNFENIAREIGPNAVIVKGLVANYFPEELRKQYFGEAHELLWRKGAPALLITDSHPDQLLAESLRLFIPLEEVKARFGSFDAFFDELAAFARRENDDFLDRFEDTRPLLSEGLKVIELKPNFFGFGVNINALIDLFRRKRQT
jgi:hypothetical protein